MIKDMIQKLMEEASEEAEHKGFCDTELSTNKATRDTKTDEVAGLKATSEELGALSQAIADLDAAVATATAQRAAEKEKNTATIADAKVVQAAVARAISVLKEFYDKAASATAFSQKAVARPTGAIGYHSRAISILKGGPALTQMRTH